MKKSVLLGLATLFTANVSYAAPTTLSTSGSWETATGSLSGLLGQAAPAVWSYDTNISSSLTLPLPSGGSLNNFSSPSYILSGTSSPLDNSNFQISLLDNSVASLDTSPISNLLINSMVNKGIDPNNTGDVIVFSTTSILPQGEVFSLFGLSIFDQNYFSSPITSLPTGQSISENSLFTFALLTHHINLGQQLTGYATYTSSPSAVPIPASAYLIAPAVLGFMGLRRKKTNF